MNKLTPRNQDFCNYSGLFGILLSLTCLIQHFSITRVHWVTFVLSLVFVFSILSFLLLAFQSALAPVFLIINSSLLLLTEALHLLVGLFSVVVILLFLYSTVVTVYIYVEGLNGKLTERALARKAERDEWKNKI